MNGVPRGQIRSRRYASQQNDFSGLAYGKITPTDIDGFLDFGGKAFVILEGKHVGAPLPLGQKIALTRNTDACQRGGVSTLLIVAEHDTRGDIDFASLPVRDYYYLRKWRPGSARTVRELIDVFLIKHDIY